MSIKVYRDNAANSIFIEDANGAQFLNSLQAVVDSGLVSIEDLAKGYQIVSSVDHTDFVDENDVVYPGTATQVCDTLNALFAASGGNGGNVPVITSNTTINLVEGETLNYELTATDGVGYEWVVGQDICFYGKLKKNVQVFSLYPKKENCQMTSAANGPW